MKEPYKKGDTVLVKEKNQEDEWVEKRYIVVDVYLHEPTIGNEKGGIVSLSGSGVDLKVRSPNSQVTKIISSNEVDFKKSYVKLID